MSENEGDLLFVAKVGEPVPGEHAFTSEREVVAERSEGFEDGVRRSRDGETSDDLALGVEDAEGERSGVEIDAAVESVLSGVEAHGVLRRAEWGPDPGSWSEGASFLKVPR
jgi:hypothetical protein